MRKPDFLDVRFFKAIAYYRLSKENRGMKNESDSIANQRKLILDYVDENPNITLVAEEYDDGFTGTNYARPGFQAVLKKLEDGEADMVIVKDLSRLGREYIETGKIIEMKFPEMNVRFVAINDDVDSEHRSDSDDLMIPFKNLMNENYCRELSKKLRRQFKIQRDNGEFINNFTSYGYLRDKNDKHRLVIDEYASEVVRGIYEMAIQGFSPNRIATYLNEHQIPAPYEYKKKTSNYQSGFKGAGESRWNAVTVRRILSNNVYIGTLTQGKTATPSFKIKKARILDEEQWSVVENNHEAIIERPVFDAVQKMLQRDTRIATSEDDVMPLSGMVFCGDCGRGMNRRTVTRYKKKFFYYICSSYKKKIGCTTHNISQKVLEDAVLECIKNQIKLIVELDQLSEQIDDGKITSLKLRRIDMMLTEKENELEKCQEISLKMYESFTEELITREEYTHMKEKYLIRMKEIEKCMKEYELKRKDVLDNSHKNTTWITQFLKYRDIDTLTHEVVVALVDRVEVFEDKRINIIFNYRDEFKELQRNIAILRKEAI